MGQRGARRYSPTFPPPTSRQEEWGEGERRVAIPIARVDPPAHGRRVAADLMRACSRRAHLRTPRSAHRLRAASPPPPARPPTPPAPAAQSPHRTPVPPPP